MTEYICISFHGSCLVCAITQNNSPRAAAINTSQSKHQQNFPRPRSWLQEGARGRHSDEAQADARQRTESGGRAGGRADRCPDAQKVSVDKPSGSVRPHAAYRRCVRSLAGHTQHTVSSPLIN